MNREDLLAALISHAASDPQEAEALASIRRFLAAPSDPFSWKNPEGHVTGSAVIARPDGSEFLLVYHRKLSRWLQPGGHTEASDASIYATALREAREETGIAQFLAPLSETIFDVDVHPIPAHGRDPAHSHFDIRYLLTSLETLHAPAAEDPARPMRWLTFDDAQRLGVDASLTRVLVKARAQLQRIASPVPDPALSRRGA